MSSVTKNKLIIVLPENLSLVLETATLAYGKSTKKEKENKRVSCKVLVNSKKKLNTPSHVTKVITE